MRIFLLIYLVVIFHLPMWKVGYKKNKYRFIEDMPKWMKVAINIRNNYESNQKLSSVFYWAKFGKFYIRKYHSHLDRSVFFSSEKHLFVLHK